MLKLFEVSGFKCFDEKITLDFSDVRDYQFNTECINDGLIGKMAIYGKNAIGKTMLSQALVDVGAHIWENPHRKEDDNYYVNTNALDKYAEFRYVFKFRNDEVEYIYRKEERRKPIYEKVSINDEIIFEYNRKQTGNRNVEGLKGIAPTLNLDFENINSVLSYVVTNTPFAPGDPLRETMSFIERMLCAPVFISAPEVLASAVFVDDGTLEGTVQEFENFLKDSGINESLDLLKDHDGKRRIYFSSPPRLFHETASRGTRALHDLFVVYKIIEKWGTSLLVLDEFDAFYHFEVSEHIVKLFQKLKHTQVIFTTHNTNLLSNRFMRPDCLFVMTKNKLTSLPNATKRELREGHNLEKLYMGGEFSE